MTEQLKDLWQLAFGDSREFVDLFFATGFSEDRFHVLTENGQVTAALYWLDCSYQGQTQAYLYAVATHPDFRGRGLCRKLMEQTRDLLKARGYAAALLRPGEEGLRAMYEKMGYQICSFVSEFSCAAGQVLPVRKVTTEEYARLRRQYLPPKGAVQEGESLSYLASYCGLYAGADFLAAGSFDGEDFRCMELLGNREAAPGILAALGCEKGFFRCPGQDLPFAMGLPLTEDAQLPGYFGLVFD